MDDLSAISAAVVTILEGVQQADSDAFTQVLDFPTSQFTGFPAATVVPAEIPSSYLTTMQNRRTYTFEVALYTSITNRNDMSNESAILRNLVVLVMNTLDIGGQPGNALLDVCDFVQPVRMAKWRIAGDNGDLLVAPIMFAAEKSVDLF